MKQMILALCALSLTVACQKSKKDDAPAAAPAPATKEGAATEGSEKIGEAIPESRLSLSKQMKLVSLGQGVSANKDILEKCLKGEPKSASYDTASVTYKIRKSLDAKNPNEMKVTAEMVVLTGESTLENADINANAKVSDEAEFTKKCGSQVVTKIYTGVRVSQSYKVSKEAAEKISEMQMSAEKSADFMAQVEKALEGSSAQAGEMKVEGMPVSASVMKLKLVDAMDEVRKLTAGDKTKNEAQVQGKNMEAELAAYPAELKAKAVPAAQPSEEKTEAAPAPKEDAATPSETAPEAPAAPETGDAKP